MKKVVIPTKLDGIAREILTANGNYEVVQDGSADLVDLADQHPNAYALVVRSEKITAELIDRLPALKVIVRAGAGFNTIDTKYARKKGIDVMNTPGANSNAVAEEVIGMMLADARHIIEADASTRTGQWEKSRFMGKEVAGKTIGIVGLGNVGRLVAKRLAGFDVKLLGHDPVISQERAKEIDVTLVDLETLFAQADCITLHTPENDETRALVNASLLSKVKHGVTIINCARAGVVDEEALRQCKREKGLRFLNDVYPRDAEGPKSIADIADIMLPHLGASTVEANFNAAKRAAEQLIDLDYRGITTYIVNRDIPDGLDEGYCELANTLARLCCLLADKNASPKLLETSVYGSLEPFAPWLLVPIVAGIWKNFEPSMDFEAARKYLDDMGIGYVNRKVDGSKRYENSITVDLTCDTGSETRQHISVRGTIAEGIQMVSRINEFDKLFFEPTGHSVMFLYDDRPGVLGRIGMKLAGAGINIEDVRNPHDARTNRSLAIMKVNRKPPAELVQETSEDVRAISAFSISL